MKKAVAYARFSTDMQREESIDAQLRAINEYCKRNDIVILDTFFDQGISGTTDERPQFQEMIYYAENNDIDFVMVHKLDRFSRSKYDSAVYKRRLKQNNIRVLSVLENLDDSPESLILESVLEGMSEYFSRNLSREVKKGMRENALKAKFNGGTPPLGYDINEEKNYVINEYEALAVQIIFNMYVQGYGYGSIINELNSNGYKTKKGNSFGKNSLYEILGNEKYIGNYIYSAENYNGFSKKRNYHNKKKREDMIVLEDAIPAIIDKETWRKAMELRKFNKKNTGHYLSKREYILNGLIYCEECKKLMTGTTRTNSRGALYSYYRCENSKCNSKSIRADKIEPLVLSCIDDVIYTQDNINVIIEAMLKYVNSNKNNEDIISLKKELTETEKSIDKFLNAILEGINPNTVKDKLNALENKKTNLISKISEIEFKNSADLDKEEIRRYFNKHNSLKEFSEKEQKIILKLFIEKITIKKPTINISLKMIDCGRLIGAGKRT